MPTLGWWRAGVRVPVIASPPPSSALAAQDVPLQHASSSSLSEMAAAAPAASSGATPWMSAMDLEAEGARYYELTNYNILHESTWGGGGGCGRSPSRHVAAAHAPAAPCITSATSLSRARFPRTAGGTSSGRARSKRSIKRKSEEYNVCWPVQGVWL